MTMIKSRDFSLFPPKRSIPVLPYSFLNFVTQRSAPSLYLVDPFLAGLYSCIKLMVVSTALINDIVL